MIKYDPDLNHTFYAFRFFLNSIKEHESDAEKYRRNPGRFDYLAKSSTFAEVARFSAARKLVEFGRFVKASGGIVFVDEGGRVCVETAGR